MANEKTYYDTEYSYIKPVRHYKANDPYYYEVDNIPIKQLEENTNFLKDQVDGLLTKEEANREIEIGRSGFSELKPYVTGNDRTVRVKPGRYTARINNAYDISPLQVIEQIAGFNNIEVSGEINTWQVQTNRGTFASSVLAEFAQGLTGTPYNMNGLAERAFVWPVDDEDGTSLGQFDLLNISSVTAYSDLDSNLNSDDRPLWPNLIGAILKHSTIDQTRDLTLIKNLFGEGTPYGGQQGRLESEFIKRWRGVIRTAVVDVPQELTIDIPDFSSDDFYIIDQNGTPQSLAANQRIDLVFIYSKAVDEESTTIPKFGTSDNPQTLTSPRLGIVRGAGLGLSRTLQSNNDTASDTVKLQSLEGVPLMVAHPGDEGGNNGFSSTAGVIKGSFPSPDDLMNMAPLLSENLETTSWPLIGQTVLPIAYILVSEAEIGVPQILTSGDIMDIRPFFRTTELAYNERAGIAAATPQISLANPVVSEAHLEKVRSEIYTDLFNRIGTGTTNTTQNGDPQANGYSKVLAAGMVLGGFNYGPEGALGRQKSTASDPEALKTSVELEFGFGQGRIPYEPEWDFANWLDVAGVNPSPFFPTACINVGDSLLARHGNDNSIAQPPYTGAAPPGFVTAATDDNYNGNIGSIGFGKTWRHHDTRKSSQGTYHHIEDFRYGNTKQNNIYFVSKKIFLNNMPTEFDDYLVRAHFLNCIPCTQTNTAGGRFNNSITTAQPAGIFIVKHKKFFIINVAFTSNAGYPGLKQSEKYEPGNEGKPWHDRNNARMFSSFMLPSFNMAGAIDPDYPDQFLSKLQDDRMDNRGRAATTQQIFDQLTADETGTPTSPQHFRAITPILYPSISFEVVGYNTNSLTENVDLSNKFGNSFIDLGGA